MTRVFRRCAQLTSLSGFAVLLALQLTASPAAAHNELSSSNPPDGAVLSSAPTAVVLTFEEEADPRFLQVAAIATDGSRVGAGTPTAVGTRVTLPLSPLSAGDYAIVYRVVSADGHPVQGKVDFTVGSAPAIVSRPGAGTPSTSAAASAPVSRNASSATNSGSTAWWPYAVFAALFLALLVVIAATVTDRTRAARRRGDSIS